MKKLVCILLSLVMLLSLFAGCGKTEETKTPEETSAKTAGDEIVLKDSAEEATITRGGTLVVAKSKNMDVGMDITREPDCSQNFTVMATIYEGLFTVDGEGNPAPGLATEWGFAEDGLSLTVKLREDVSFSNGEKMNAEAVAKCLNYYISEECNHVFKSSDLSLITGVDVVDEYTVQINTSAPDSALCNELASSSGFIMAPANIDNKDYTTNPIGTGPFVLDEYREGEYVTVKANPNYYQIGEDGKPLPYLDGIKFVFMTDDTTSITNLKSGDVHGVDRHGSSTSTLTAQSMDNVNVYQNPTTQTYNITCNLHDEVMKNDSLRQAIMYAINAEEIIDIAMEGFGAYSPFWTDEGKWFYNDYNPYTYDVEKAKALMAEAGYENGLDLELAIIAREPDNTIAQLVQAQLGEIGINLKVNAMDSASWVAYVRNEHKDQLALSLVGNVGYDPAKAWVIILNSFGGVNTGLELVDRLNSLAVESKAEVDTVKRDALIDEYQHLVLANGLNASIGHKYAYGSFLNTVHNVEFHFAGFWLFHDAWMEQ